MPTQEDNSTSGMMALQPNQAPATAMRTKSPRPIAGVSIFRSHSKVNAGIAKNR